MATLVFSTIGTALGGPVGSAIGALVGQSIDQQLLAPVRRGPRVGDLGVQTSSYGTQVPRVYGTMRVAGSVVWSTDLIERSDTGGAKGQPDVTYSYVVSIAVAVSSRRVKSIGRIWADGKLIRGEAGDFKIGTKFRFASGDEDQGVDPLIAASEGIGQTPAYRGLALCVFEDLELGEFGNRIPFLTFEVVADDEPISIAELMDDVSRGLVTTDEERTLGGFAAYGRSVADAIEPIISTFGLDVFDDGSVLRSPSVLGEINVASDELGNSADGKLVPRSEQEQIAARSLPASVRIKHYDPSRDYQAGEARSSIGSVGSDAQYELPAVLSADQAKGVANEMLARTWARRDRLTLRLPTARMQIAPGAVLSLPMTPAKWQVVAVTIESFVTVVQLRPATEIIGHVAADGGRAAVSADEVVGSITIALFDIPDPISVTGEPALLLAATSDGQAWKSRGVEVQVGAAESETTTARNKSVLGHALTALADGTAYLVDELGSVDVQLIDQDQWLTSCDESALPAGTNAAVLGSELIQFGRAEALGGGRFRLSRLMRGRGGTEWASTSHQAGESFCLLQPGTYSRIQLPLATLGATVTARVGEAQDSASLQGEALRPLAPCRVVAKSEAEGGVRLGWTRRSRAGFAWVDGIDAPLGETREQYRVVVSASGRSIELTSIEPTLLIDDVTIMELGGGTVTAEIQQVGDYAASRPTQIIFNISEN